MKSDEDFIRDFNTSVAVTMEVASWLATQGYDCRVRPSVLRPSAGVRMDFTDQGDIEIIQRCEVKYRSIDFSSVESWPFPDIIIDEAYKMANYEPETLYGYAMVNKARSGMLLIPRATRAQWFESALWDKKQQRNCINICAPRDCATYHALS